MSNQYIGEIRYFPYRRGAPEGWVICDGSQLPISGNETLFQLIGVTYGGDGQSTFNVPDLRGRLGVGTGAGSVLGQVMGQEKVTLTTTQIPSHSHTLQASTSAATSTNPSGQVFAAGANLYFAPPAAPVPVAMAPAAIGSTGFNQPHENCAPTLAILPCICSEGVYPSPN